MPHCLLLILSAITFSKLFSTQCIPGYYYLQDYPVIILEEKSFGLPEGMAEDDLSPDAADRRNGVYCNYKREDGSYIFPYFQETCTPFIDDIAVVGESAWNYQTKHCPNVKVDSAIYTDDFDRDFDYMDFSVCGHEFDRRFGYMRRDGTMLTDFSYHDASFFYDDYALTYEIEDNIKYRKACGEENSRYIYINKAGENRFGNNIIIKYARTFKHKVTIASYSHVSPSIDNAESDECPEDYYHNNYLLDNQFRIIAGPFQFIFEYDDDSEFVHVESKTDHGYLSLNNEWVCHPCWGANVSHNRACLYAQKEEIDRIQPCKIINERGKPVAKYSLYGFLLTDKNDFDYLHKKLLVTFDNTAGCLNRLRVVESMIQNQWYRFMYHIKLLHFKITKPSRYDNVITTQNGYILWPPGWNDPCADTDGVIVWPKGACKP